MSLRRRAAGKIHIFLFFAGLFVTAIAKAIALKITLKGAASTAAVHGADQLPGEANYYIGNPNQWITHVPTYKKVVTEDLYPGIECAGICIHLLDVHRRQQR